MPNRYLQLEDIRGLKTPDKVTNAFRLLGYNPVGESLDIEDLELSPRNTEAIYDAHLIADQDDGGLQVILFELHSEEWETPSTASTRMKSIATQVGRRDTEFLLLAATKDYNQLMLVNPRKTFDEQKNLKVNIRKLLIDRTNPTAYDRDRLEALAVNGKTSQEIYQAHCEAFDVKKLTEQFYERYKTLFERVQETIKEYNTHSYFQDKDRLHQFSQRLLGRIMFLYFLQKKEFLAGDHKFLTTQYKVNDFDENGYDYYWDILEPLFFETLNHERPQHDSPWGKIPYLNGGLFDRDYGEGIKDAAGRETPETVELPNSLFDPGDPNSILGYFNGYNFTIAENVAGDEDVAIDPEMLGKVFENMLAAKERGKSGTFYTPRGIVQFMCTEVLARYLADESGMELEAVQAVMEADPDLLDADFNALLTPQQARQLKKALTTIKVLDPAVGSGAFPLGMLQIMVQVKQAIARREGMVVKRGSLTISQWKREIIANNLYGVDIKPEAVEIAKLRMWLSLVVDIPHIEDVEPLPNLDYKLMCGDSLISTIHGEQLIPDPTKEQQLMLAVTPIQQAIQPLLELQKQYFDAQTEERHQLREQILAAEANVFRVAVRDRLNYWEGKLEDLQREIMMMKGKVSKKQQKEQTLIGAKLMELNQFAEEVESGERSLNFFQYHLHFRDVFTEKGGFDVVIGNPPYLKIQTINKEESNLFKQTFESATGKFDIYVLFVEKSFDFIRRQGIIGYIHPHKFVTADYGRGLKSFLETIQGIKLSIIFGVNQVFDSATTYSGLFLYSFNNDSIYLKHSNITDLYENNYQKIYYKNCSIPWTYFSSETSNEKDNIIRKIANYPNSLETILAGIFQGTVTGGNNIFVLEGNLNDQYFEGSSYALNCQVKIEAGIVKPLLLGENIRRYQKPLSNSVVFYAYYKDKSGKTKPLPEHILESQYPLAYDYIKNFKSVLVEKRNKYKTNPNFWYTLHRGREMNIFEHQKILTPQLQNYPNFTLDLEGWYTDGGYCLVLPENTEKDYKLLLGILNSFVLWFFIKNTSHPYNNNYYYFKTKYLKPFSIPLVPEADRLAIEALVQKCLDAKGQGVEEWEAEIDDRVAHLYGLTAEDMKIIRGE